MTTDALNCRRDIAQKIVENEGDYVLALKGNHRTLHADVRDLLDELSCEAADKHSTVDSNHGRIETRTALISADIKELDERHRWSGLAAVGKVARTRDTPTSATTETAYYLMSAVLSPERLGQVVRSHWGVENRLHWVLNAVMNEDQTRNRYDNSHMALNLIQRDRSQVSIRSKFNLAGWKDEFLAKLLTET